MSPEDLKSVLAFYESPVGQRYIEGQSRMMEDVGETASTYWRSVVIPELIEEMAIEFPELKERPGQ